MNQYDIQHKIKALAKIDEDYSGASIKAEFFIDNLCFRQWDCTEQDGSIGDAWIVQTQIEAENSVDAYVVLVQKLNEILPRICFVSQCFLDFGHESFLILKKNNNPDNVFAFKRFDETKGGGLSFGKQEETAVKKLKGYQYPQVFKFLQESINTTNYYARTALMLAALEAMSGEVQAMSCNCENAKKRLTYNRNEMKKILNDDELVDSLFGSGGIRHKLFHGNIKDFESAFPEDYFSKIHKAIIRYFNNLYSVKITEDAKDVPRDFIIKSEIFLPLKAKGFVSLQDVVKTFCENLYYPGQKVGNFEVLGRDKLSSY